MKFLFKPALNLGTSSTRVSSVLLLLRVFVGVAFLFHGVGKLAAPFGWMGPDAPVPGILQALAVLAEVGGGIALIVGFLTPLASLGLVITMAVAALFHIGKGDAFVGGYELALNYLVLSLLLLVTGPGRFSVDSVIASKSKNELASPSSRHASVA